MDSYDENIDYNVNVKFKINNFAFIQHTNL